MSGVTMNWILEKILMFLIFGCLSLVVLRQRDVRHMLLYFTPLNPTIRGHQQSQKLTTATTIQSPAATPNLNSGCFVRRINPFHPSAMKYVKREGRPNCRQLQENIVNVTGDGHVTITNNTHAQCFYQEVTRRKDSDYIVDFLDKQPLYHNMTIPCDLAWVTCQQKGKVVYENLFALVQKRNGTIESSKRTPSVFMFGLDSLSGQNSLRLLKKLNSFLQVKLKSHHMRTHVKVGANTKPNLGAMLLGKSFRHLRHLMPHCNTDNCKAHFLDDAPWIWKEFARKGYTTAFIESNKKIEHTFNNRETNGFRLLPTHHYLRPFYKAWSKCKQNSSIAKKAKKPCLMDRPRYTNLLEYGIALMRAYKGTPLFLFSFCGLTHHSLGQFAYFDEPYTEMLETLYQEGLLENTIVIGFGDHGLRFGPFRKTWMGRMEDNMPWMTISLPEWMRKEYPHLDESLSYNQEIITTHFDVHKTLQHIASGQLEINNTLVPSRKGRKWKRRAASSSLFRKLDKKRTCWEARVSQAYCPCGEELKVDVHDEQINLVAEDITKEINGYLKLTKGKCATLHSTEVLEASYINKEMDLLSLREDNHPDLRLQIKVQPSNGIFESTMTFQQDRYIRNGSLQRIDEYGDQGNCMEDSFLEPFCLCQSG